MSTTDAGPGIDPLRVVVDAFDRKDLARPLSALSFWMAILLPVLYLPLLAHGIESLEGLGLFLGLFGLHVLALVGGHPHAGTSSR